MKINNPAPDAWMPTTAFGLTPGVLDVVGDPMCNGSRSCVVAGVVALLMLASLVVLAGLVVTLAVLFAVGAGAGVASAAERRSAARRSR